MKIAHKSKRVVPPVRIARHLNIAVLLIVEFDSLDSIHKLQKSYQSY